jgi:F-type H+-transporting ATPase subunit b
LLERKNKVSGLEESVENFSNSAKQKDSEYDSGIKAARSKGMEEKAVLIQIAEEEEKAIIAKINEKAQEDIAKVREKIAKDAEAAKNQLLKQVDMFANEIGKKILGRAV